MVVYLDKTHGKPGKPLSSVYEMFKAAGAWCSSKLNLSRTRQGSPPEKRVSPESEPLLSASGPENDGDLFAYWRVSEEPEYHDDLLFVRANTDGVMEDKAGGYSEVQPYNLEQASAGFHTARQLFDDGKPHLGLPKMVDHFVTLLLDVPIPVGTMKDAYFKELNVMATLLRELCPSPATLMRIVSPHPDSFSDYDLGLVREALFGDQMNLGNARKTLADMTAFIADKTVVLSMSETDEYVYPQDAVALQVSESDLSQLFGQMMNYELASGYDVSNPGYQSILQKCKEQFRPKTMFSVIMKLDGPVSQKMDLFLRVCPGLEPAEVASLSKNLDDAFTGELDQRDDTAIAFLMVVCERAAHKSLGDLLSSLPQRKLTHAVERTRWLQHARKHNSFWSEAPIADIMSKYGVSDDPDAIYDLPQK